METTIKINTDSIPPDFVDGIKKLFPYKMVIWLKEISIVPLSKHFRFWDLCVNLRAILRNHNRKHKIVRGMF